jgi:hypothetical protein
VDEALDRLERLRALGYATEQTGIRRQGSRYGYADTSALLGAYLELLGDPWRSPVPVGTDVEQWRREVEEWVSGTEQRRREARALPPGDGLGTRRVAQVAFVVRDPGDASTRLTQLVGGDAPSVRSTDDVEVGPVTFRGRPIAGACRWAMVPVEQSMVIELLQPAAEPSVWRESLDARGPCMHHLGFEVRDEAAADHLRALGYEELQRGQWEGGGYAYFATRDDLGIDLELLSRPLERR